MRSRKYIPMLMLLALLSCAGKAGAQTVAVRYTAFGWEKLVEEGRPDFVIARPQELLEIVGK